MAYLHHEFRDQTLRGKLFRSVREIVFGLEDGIVSTLGAITGIAGGTQDLFVVILAGFVIIFVESLSMAAGTYLSSKSERELEERMMAEEREEIETDPEGERQELVAFYRERGFSDPEVEMMVNRVTSNKELWLEEMAYRELGVIPHDAPTYKMDALLMGVSYIIGGIVPLTAYFFFPLAVALPVSIGASLVILFLIGYGKGKLVHVNRLRSGLEMLLVSVTAAGLGYIIGRLVDTFFHL
jgi:predicted membrane protein (TIGR00267 family)